DEVWTLCVSWALLPPPRPGVNTFSDDPVARFGRGELVLAMGTSADFDLVRRQPGRAADTAFVLPKGRSEMWTDAWVTPVAGRHPETALQWIDAQLAAPAAALAWAASRLPAPERGAAPPLPRAGPHRHASA